VSKVVGVTGQAARSEKWQGLRTALFPRALHSHHLSVTHDRLLNGELGQPQQLGLSGLPQWARRFQPGWRRGPSAPLTAYREADGDVARTSDEGTAPRPRPRTARWQWRPHNLGCRYDATPTDSERANERGSYTWEVTPGDTVSRRQGFQAAMVSGNNGSCRRRRLQHTDRCQVRGYMWQGAPTDYR